MAYDIFLDLRKKIHSLIEESSKSLNVTLENNLLNKVSVEIPKDKNFGCITVNAAMILAKTYQKKPRELAEIFTEIFTENLTDAKAINIAGPGFINISFDNIFWHKALKNIANNLGNYGQNNLGNNEKINLEFGSPNPTGPLHIGHARGAIYGDVLSRILKFSGFDVTKENYINDAGKQIDILAKSVFLRYKEIATGKAETIPKGLYPGEYLIPVAQGIYDKYGNQLLDLENENEYLSIIKEKSISEMVELIREGFATLNISHDVYFSELSLHTENRIAKTIELLKKQNKASMGVLPKPKGIDSKDWETKEQLLFKATEYGDDIDRVLQKNNGDWTYFAADCAYHQDKINRGFNKMILVLGADHGGYIKRMKALVKALSNDKATIDIKICQLVNFYKNGEAVKMSKRDGSYLSVDDVVNEVGDGVLRFLMLTRKNDAIFDFDLQKALEQSKDNPVFYVQYAHARICSVLRKTESFSFDQNTDYTSLNHDAEIELIKTLSLYPQIIRTIANNYEVHLITFYLQNLAAQFHAYWNLGKLDENLRFISDDKQNMQARISLLYIIKTVIASGLHLLNIQPMDKM